MISDNHHLREINL